MIYEPSLIFMFSFITLCDWKLHIFLQEGNCMTLKTINLHVKEHDCSKNYNPDYFFII